MGDDRESLFAPIAGAVKTVKNCVHGDAVEVDVRDGKADTAPDNA